MQHTTTAALLNTTSDPAMSGRYNQSSMLRREFLAGALSTAARAKAPQQFVGITLMPEYIQSEGIEAVLGNLRRAGATAVATSPYVMAPSDAPDAQREPPIDAGAGGVRLLDRPLWGKRELRVTTAPS